jgi:hypothetical protein
MASASFEQLEYYLGDNIYSESDDIGVKVARWINWNAAKDTPSAFQLPAQSGQICAPKTEL